MYRIAPLALLIAFHAPLSAADTVTLTRLSDDQIRIIHQCNDGPSAADSMRYAYELDLSDLDTSQTASLSSALSSGTAELALTIKGSNNGTSDTRASFSGRATVRLPQSGAGRGLGVMGQQLGFDDYGVFTKKIISGTRPSGPPLNQMIKLTPGDSIQVDVTGSGEVVCDSPPVVESPNRFLGVRVQEVTLTF